MGKRSSPGISSNGDEQSFCTGGPTAQKTEKGPFLLLSRSGPLWAAKPGTAPELRVQALLSVLISALSTLPRETRPTDRLDRESRKEMGHTATGQGTRWCRRNEVRNQDMALPRFSKSHPFYLHQDQGPRPVGEPTPYSPSMGSKTGFLVCLGYAEKKQNIP